MTDTMRAITLMVFAMFLFTVADLFVKLASQSLSPWLVVFLMGFGTASVFLIALWVSGQKIYKSSYLHWTVFLRLVGEVIAALAIIAALSVVPLATVTAVLQSQPLLLTAAGALFLGEKVGPRRTFAVLLGFIGVMVIMRPTQDGFTIFSMLVLLSVVGMTIRDVGSRIVPAHIPTLVIAFYGASAVAVVGGIMMVVSNQLYLPQG
ncbi:MAG: DMT family transporter, partial [Candidatus Puniceispirillaceae bacterium]